MRLSEFWLAVAEEFGDGYGRVLTRDLVLGALDGLTADEALAKGRPPREVWLALCAAMDIPPERRYGVGRRDPRRG
ncbi:hypothetical protein M2152_000870 [Microbacteriaceae bacterium SG_E_30_P1]|uniref:DUF3046 domain-containing protein n=1 Tax=Antiquaquibacter oligotrophicus TaxID=2880260 RepID=A0ABT6KL17_9MICO|nr:DUF3046 domain-containing protein [Antiquaquibacter oligotrophicus]MDH6180688.1 hypothetical protein [Antiquaquibacter oligotrophicus]UDF13586.1 DUF3046 domain-containing protein [Antiquaquibacter oligotrophicus]